MKAYSIHVLVTETATGRNRWASAELDPSELDLPLLQLVERHVMPVTAQALHLFKIPDEEKKSA